MAFSPNIQNILNSQQPQQKQGGFLNSVGNLLDNPFLMNLLAQQGFSTVPQSKLGAVGRAGVATAKQERQTGLDEIQKRFLESRIGLNEAQSAGGGTLGSTNVQTTFKGANGNMHIVLRNGTVKDTGSPFNENVKFFTQADGSVVGVDSSTGDRLGTVISSEEAAESTLRKRQQEAAFTLPTDLAGLDSVTNKIDTTMSKLDEVLPLVTEANVGIESAVRADLPGFLGGGPRKLKQQVKSLQAEFGFDTLQKMRSASKTGGALGQVSERELDLLINALRTIDLEGDVNTLRDNLNAVRTHYENYKREIEVMKNAMRKQAGKPEVTQDRSMSEMTDAELEAIISGG